MPGEAPAVLRALEGLRQFSGRTLAVIGPPTSGKSAVLDRIAEAAESLSARVVRLKGNSADRLVPFGALAELDSVGVVEPGGEVGPGDGTSAENGVAPMAPVAVNPGALPRAHRRRTERGRPSIFAESGRPRGAGAVELTSYWENLLREFRGDGAHPVVLLVDDAAYLDPESRGFLLALGAKARLRPLLLVVALDTRVAETSLWQEALAHREETDWVRQPDSAPDAREVRRYRELLDRFPPRTRRMVGYLALLGGDVPEHLVSRIAHLGHGPLLDLLRPATERGLIRVRDGKIGFSDGSAPPIVAGLFDEPLRAELHREVAEALEALSPEPTVARRIEVARHYLASRRGPTAMAHLVQAAEASLDLGAFDDAAELLGEAFGCLVDVPPGDRKTLEPEVRLYLARALFYGGRPAEAEGHLREGVERALEAGLARAELSGALEPLLLAMRAVGPRWSLVTTLAEISDRCRDKGQEEAAVLLETLRTELLVERHASERSEEAALRVAQLARGSPERHVQALGLVAMGLYRTAQGDEIFPAERFLRSAHHLLANTGRWELDYLVAEVEVELVQESGDLEQARHLREASLAVLASEKFPSIELAHHLGIAAIDLDRGNAESAGASLARAHHLLETMRLLPPSPHLLRYWLLEGRRQALLKESSSATEYWSAIVDLPSDAGVPRLRAEALVRLGLLSSELGDAEAPQRLGLVPPTAPDLAALPLTWRAWLDHGAALSTPVLHGGGPLPPPGPRPSTV